MTKNIEAIERLITAQAEQDRDKPSEQTKAPHKPSAGACSEMTRAELLEMMEQVNLVDVIADDTGIAPSHASEGIATYNGQCPICGHSDCFRVNTSSSPAMWNCHSASNPSRKAGNSADGGNVLDWKTRTQGMSDTEAIAWLRQETGNPYKPHEKRGGNHFRSMPPITPIQIVDPPKRAPVLISDLLRCGHKMLITAQSKAGKTFLAAELALAVATGTEWLGFDCTQGRVLYVNLEVDSRSFANRCSFIAKHLDIDLARAEANLDVWNLRGHVSDMRQFTNTLITQVQSGQYALVILDPLYKLQDGDENSAKDVRLFWNDVDRITSALGCSVAAIHHHSKGAKGDVAAIDRGSGSGVFARDPDAILDLVEVFPSNIEDKALLGSPNASAWRVSDGGLREFKPLRPFNIIFEHPTHRLDVEGITQDWKPQSAQSKGGKSSADTKKLQSELEASRCIARLACEFCRRGVGVDGVSLSEAVNMCADADGATPNRNSFRKYIEESDCFELEKISARKIMVRFRSGQTRLENVAG